MIYFLQCEGLRLSEVHNGHRDRLRKKFLSGGIDSFEDHEILELVLFYIIPRKNTNQIAHALLKDFGSISAIFDAPISRLRESEGIGEKAAVFIKLIANLSRLYFEKKYNSKDQILSAQEINRRLIHKFIGRNEETLAMMLFDAKGKVIFEGIVNKGSINGVELYIRKMIELVTFYNANSIIIAHNHPSGVALPSRDDVASTEKIYDLFGTMQVTVLDHIIVADNDCVSLRQTVPEIFGLRKKALDCEAK